MELCVADYFNRSFLSVYPCLPVLNSPPHPLAPIHSLIHFPASAIHQSLHFVNADFIQDPAIMARASWHRRLAAREPLSPHLHLQVTGGRPGAWRMSPSIAQASKNTNAAARLLTKLLTLFSHTHWHRQTYAHTHTSAIDKVRWRESRQERTRKDRQQERDREQEREEESKKKGERNREWHWERGGGREMFTGFSETIGTPVRRQLNLSFLAHTSIEITQRKCITN